MPPAASRREERMGGVAGEWIETTCRRRYALQAVLTGIFAGLALRLLVVGVKASADDLAGPHDVDDATLAAATKPESFAHQFVRLNCRGAVETGVAWVEKTTHYGVETGSTTTPYWAVPHGDHF